MGGKYDIKPETTNKIMDSFGVAPDSPLLPAQQAVIQQQIVPQLKQAPKWMKRPCGVSFGFGGKLVTFGVDTVAQATASLNAIEHHQTPKFQAQKVNIMQIVTDTDLVDESQKLENALQAGQVLEYCNYKIETISNTSDQQIWKFILVSECVCVCNIVLKLNIFNFKGKF